VGRFVEKKGFEYLIEACALLQKKGRTFRCKVLGTGELETSLRALIRERGLESTVAMLGPCPQNEMTKHVHDAAALAAPCVVGQDGNRDGLPTVLLEAMALGTPCVSTDVTGVPEAVQDGITGLIVPQRDPAALATAIERLLDEPALRVQLAQRARALVEAEFDIHMNAARLRKTLFSPRT
jgi:glycosyltransferase involved in cell wall biosynthesis